jgi:hypothetical protein
MKVLIFYTTVSTVIALIAQLAHASLGIIILTSLLVPPIILLIVRIIRY